MKQNPHMSRLKNDQLDNGCFHVIYYIYFTIEQINMDKPSDCDGLSYDEIIEILEAMSYEEETAYEPLDFHDETEFKD